MSDALEEIGRSEWEHAEIRRYNMSPSCLISLHLTATATLASSLLIEAQRGVEVNACSLMAHRTPL